jgi:hypothetical protein
MLLNIRFTAKSPEQVAKGLMHSSPLERDECALFVFGHPDGYSFWNKNVDYPISLFFLDENFEIKNIGHLDAQQEKPCRSEYPMTKYVVEGHSDLPKEFDIKIGDFCLPENEKIKILKGKRKELKNI